MSLFLRNFNESLLSVMPYSRSVMLNLSILDKEPDDTDERTQTRLSNLLQERCRGPLRKLPKPKPGVLSQAMCEAQQHGSQSPPALPSQEPALRAPQKAATFESPTQRFGRDDLRAFNYATIHTRVAQAAVGPSEQ